MAAKKKNPYVSMGVNENAAVRMVKMVQPLCPIPVSGDRREFDKLFPEFAGQISCQAGRFYYGWQKECEAKGHNPYFTTRKQILLERIVDEGGIVTGTREKVITSTGPNIMPVTLASRHSGGEDVTKALRRGFKFTKDLDYEEICEFRGCENPVKVKTKYGNYCNERHARLIAADVKKIFLPVGGVEGSDWEEDREDRLSSISLKD